MKIIHLTDPHLVVPGERLFGLDPLERFYRCVQHINSHHADADLCVITGDLVDSGRPEAYALLRDCLSALKPPHRLLLGNHDDRAAFLKAFPDTPVDPNGFVVSVADMPAGRLLLLDTLEPGRPEGVLCDCRMAWLEARLVEVDGLPVFIFMHHPPRTLGILHFADMCLTRSDDFLSLLHRHGAVRHIMFGHVHLNTTGCWDGVPFSANCGTCHQILLDLDEPDVAFVEAPPSYGVLLVDGATSITHCVTVPDAIKCIHISKAPPARHAVGMKA